MKTYKFTYLDKENNELTSKKIQAFDIKDAHKWRNRELAECMMNDCVKIKVTLVKQGK